MKIINSKLKKLSKEFNLKYKLEWFRYIWISRRENILIEYIYMCPDPIYEKFGKTSSKRIENIGKFINSKEFQELTTKRYGGQIIISKNFDKPFLKRVKSIKEKKVMKECLNIYKKIINSTKNQEEIAVLTKTSKKKEKEFLIKNILLHEFIHILLYKNKIYFKKQNEKYWQYDEGLCTFCEEFLANSLEKLEDKVKKTRYPMEKQYYLYAIKFRYLLKDKNIPEERKMEILKLKNKIK